MRSITRYLETTLKLTVNLAKSRVAPMSECSFLGFTVLGKKMRWTDKALASFKRRVKELSGRSWGGIDEIPAAQTGRICAGLGGVLRRGTSASASTSAQNRTG